MTPAVVETIRVLLVEDSPEDADLIMEALGEVRGDGPAFVVQHAGRLSDALPNIESLAPDVVLLDLSLPDSWGLATFIRMHGAAPDIPIVVLSGLADESTAMATVRQGAQEYLVKGEINAAVLARSLRYAIERKRVELVHARFVREQAAREEAEAARRRVEELATQLAAERDRLQDEVSERLRAEHALEQALQARDRFFASVSHDLRTPLAAIKGYAQVLRRLLVKLEGDSTETVTRIDEGLRNIDATAAQVNSMIEELLDLARLELGQEVELRCAPTDLISVARQSAESFQATTSQHRIGVVSGINALVGTWDSPRLRRVLDNLVSNAIKYSPGGGEIVLEVSREDRDDGSWAVISVRDSGIGIPEQDVARVFDRFYRAGNAGHFTGVGVGLCGAREIVLRHGGTIIAVSREGAGSTFTITLPMNAAGWLSGEPVSNAGLMDKGLPVDPSLASTQYAISNL